MIDYIISETKYKKDHNTDFSEIMGIVFFVAGSLMFLLWLWA